MHRFYIYTSWMQFCIFLLAEIIIFGLTMEWWCCNYLNRTLTHDPTQQLSIFCFEPPYFECGCRSWCGPVSSNGRASSIVHLPHPLEFWPLWQEEQRHGPEQQHPACTTSADPERPWPCPAPLPWQCSGINANLGPFPTGFLDMAPLFSGLKAFSPIGANYAGPVSLWAVGPWAVLQYAAIAYNSHLTFLLFSIFTP